MGNRLVTTFLLALALLAIVYALGPRVAVDTTIVRADPASKDRANVR